VGHDEQPDVWRNASSIDTFSNAAHQRRCCSLPATTEGRGRGRHSDPLSISNPATSKNAVVVGASGNTSEPFNDANEQDRLPTSSVGPATNASKRIAPCSWHLTTSGPGLQHGVRLEYSCRSNDNDQTNAVECDVAQGLTG
jgi:hypothetical protein